MSSKSDTALLLLFLPFFIIVVLKIFLVNLFPAPEINVTDEGFLVEYYNVSLIDFGGLNYTVIDKHTALVHERNGELHVNIFDIRVDGNNVVYSVASFVPFLFLFFLFLIITTITLLPLTFTIPGIEGDVDAAVGISDINAVLTGVIAVIIELSRISSITRGPTVYMILPLVLFDTAFLIGVLALFHELPPTIRAAVAVRHMWIPLGVLAFDVFVSWQPLLILPTIITILFAINWSVNKIADYTKGIERKRKREERREKKKSELEEAAEKLLVASKL